MIPVGTVSIPIDVNGKYLPNKFGQESLYKNHVLFFTTLQQTICSGNFLANFILSLKPG